MDGNPQDWKCGMNQSTIWEKTMKTILTAMLLVLSANASAWNYLSSDIYRGDRSSNLTTFGGDRFRTTTGTIRGENVNIQTYGSDTFSTTFGTIGNQNVNCHSYGSGSFKTTNCY